MTSSRRTNEPSVEKLSAQPAGATAGRDLARVAMPGHPVKEGAGYDCACGECLVLRRQTLFGGHEFAYESHTDLFRCIRCHRYEVTVRKKDDTIELCDGVPPAGSGPIEVNMF